MAYTPNNPYIPGDPYSYDLKWIVAQLQSINSSISELDEKIAAAVIAALDQHDPIYYNSAAELIASGQNADSIAYIQGYYSAGDGGANLYYVTDDYNNIIDQPFYLTLDESNKWAVPVILTPYVTPEMFGAYGNGEIDDTKALNIAINFPVIVANNTYLVSVDREGNSAINSENNTWHISGTFILTANAYNNYAIINCGDNVIINGGTFIGERTSHELTSGEWGHNIVIENSDNVTLNNVIATNAFGDGCYIRQSHNIKINNCTFENNRRNGLSIISGTDIIASNCSYLNNSGTAPQSGFDIEPNRDDTELEVLINGGYSAGNGGPDGIGNYYVDNANVIVTGIIGDKFGVRNTTAESIIKITNCEFNPTETYYPLTLSNTSESSILLFSNNTINGVNSDSSNVIYYPTATATNINILNNNFINFSDIARFGIWPVGATERNGYNNKFMYNTFTNITSASESETNYMFVPFIILNDRYTNTDVSYNKGIVLTLDNAAANSVIPPWVSTVIFTGTPTGTRFFPAIVGNNGEITIINNSTLDLIIDSRYNGGYSKIILSGEAWLYNNRNMANLVESACWIQLTSAS